MNQRDPSTPRVVYWNNMPAPYVVERFETLARRGAFRFQAWFSSRREADRSWAVEENSWGFPWRYLGRNHDTTPTPYAVVRRLHQTRPDLLVSHYAGAVWAAGSLAAQSLGIRTAYRVMPSYDTWVRRSHFKEWCKHLLFARIDGVKTPGPDGAQIALKYGVPRQRIHYVTQSVNLERFRDARRAAPDHGDRRRALGLSGVVLLYVGRLWRGKGLDHLLQAYRLIKGACDVSLLLVGDGVDEQRYRRMAADLPGVQFAGFVQPRDIASWYGLGDVFVLPTLGDPHGLVVEEAMAAGLPVIATTAAGDIRQRLGDGRAGCIVPAADPEALAESIRALALDAERRQSLGAAGQNLAANLGHDRWADDFEHFVEAVLAMPPKRKMKR